MPDRLMPNPPYRPSSDPLQEYKASMGGDIGFLSPDLLFNLMKSAANPGRIGMFEDGSPLTNQSYYRPAPARDAVDRPELQTMLRLLDDYTKNVPQSGGPIQALEMVDHPRDMRGRSGQGGPGLSGLFGSGGPSGPVPVAAPTAAPSPAGTPTSLAPAPFLNALAGLLGRGRM